MIRWRYSNSRSLTIPNTGVYLWVQGLVIFGIALYIRSRFMDWPLRFDEYYHILAARSWAIDGSFNILDGEYKRGYLYTALVGWLFSLFGESIEIARLPSLLAGSLNVLLIFLFVNRSVGNTAAWISSLFFVFDPTAIDLSTQIRFYALQSLLFWIAAFLVFYGSQHPISIHLKLGVAIIILPILALATHLQPITLIGAAGFVIWIVVEHGSKIIGIIRHFMLAHTVWAIIIGLILIVVIFLTRNDLSNILETYRSSPAWSIRHRHNPMFYHYWLMKQYPFFWSFFPIAVLVLIRSHKRIVAYCLVMFMTLLLLHSFGGAKDPRYFNYALPFLFVIWGVFLAEMFQTIRDLLIDENMSKQPDRYCQTIGSVFAIILFSYSILNLNYATYLQTKKQMHKEAALLGMWTSAKTLLKQFADQVDIVMVTSGTKAIYHIGRLDYAISPSIVKETESQLEFGRDYSTGRYIIGTAQSIKKILDCTASGLLVSEQNSWNNPVIGIDKEGVDVLLERTQEIQTPNEWGLIVRSWRSPNRKFSPECEDLPRR